MSMINYPEYGFGLVLAGNDVEDFIRQQGFEDADVYDFVESCETMKHTVRYYPADEFEGSSYHMLDGTSGEYEAMLVVWTFTQPSIFEAAYSDETAVANELKEEFNFPDNFDWKAHLGYFAGCIYC